MNLKNSIEPLLTSLNSNDSDLNLLKLEAISLTSKHYENKRTLFNPIYVSDICMADCPYCGYRKSNKSFKRRTLNHDALINEVDFLSKRGIRNILLLAGDYKHSEYVSMIASCIKTLREYRNLYWLGLEIATLETNEYRILKDAGADSVTVFQETYNKERYRQLHLLPKFKGDYKFRYNAQERAINAGFKEVGLGVLYGIGNWISDTLAMAEHAIKLKTKYPEIKLRFSFPRLQQSIGQSQDCATEDISEQKLLRAIVGIRLCFPYDSLVLTGRESIDFLCNTASIVNSLGYAGSTTVGGYTYNDNCLSQFSLNIDNNYNDFLHSLEKHRYNFIL